MDDESLLAAIAQAAEYCTQTICEGGKILFAGNGGSASDSQHIAAELVGRLDQDRKALAAIALTTDTSILTAVGNDYGFDQIFARQMAALGRSGDVFVGISTSGNSANVVNAVQLAQQTGLKTIGLCGASGGALLEQCDVAICVPSDQTQHIQEAHIAIGHILCLLIQQQVLGVG